VRGYLKMLAARHSASAKKRREREALERSFKGFQFPVGKRTWKRAAGSNLEAGGNQYV
jgi:hypothetical protein